MKAILEFNLPDDQDTFDLHVMAYDMRISLIEIKDYLRSKSKYETENEVKWEAYNEVYEHFFEILNDNNIKL
jgi:hypothetical protein